MQGQRLGGNVARSERKHDKTEFPSECRMNSHVDSSVFLSRALAIKIRSIDAGAKFMLCS
jgi:hypothetical protein